MQKLKLDLELLSVQAFDTMPSSTASDYGPSDNCSANCGGSERHCYAGAVFAHQNDTMPEKDPVEPTTKEQHEQQRDPGLQSYKSGGEGGPASDPDQNIIIEGDPGYARPQHAKDDKLR